jgi:hypothetical protein
MSEKWDGKVFASTPGGPVVTMSLGDVLARKDDEIERLRAEVERLRARVEVLERVREAALPHLFEPSMASGTVLLKALQDAKP